MLKYETIAQDIQSHIEDGALAPNDKLPTVVDLCERYGVSKITVKRAFEILTERGLIASKRGSGTYVKNTTELFDTGAVDPLLMGEDGTREDTFGFTRSDHQARPADRLHRLAQRAREERELGGLRLLGHEPARERRAAPEHLPRRLHLLLLPGASP